MKWTAEKILTEVKVKQFTKPELQLTDVKKHKYKWLRIDEQNINLLPNYMEDKQLDKIQMLYNKMSIKHGQHRQLINSKPRSKMGTHGSPSLSQI